LRVAGLADAQQGRFALPCPQVYAERSGIQVLGKSNGTTTPSLATAAPCLAAVDEPPDSRSDLEDYAIAVSATQSRSVDIAG
jgi:hypothetical protein